MICNSPCSRHRLFSTERPEPPRVKTKHPAKKPDHDTWIVALVVDGACSVASRVVVLNSLEDSRVRHSIDWISSSSCVGDLFMCSRLGFAPWAHVSLHVMLLHHGRTQRDDATLSNLPTCRLFDCVPQLLRGHLAGGAGRLPWSEGRGRGGRSPPRCGSLEQSAMSRPEVSHGLQLQPYG